MDTIFISYRRDETSGHAGRIYDRLSEKFGKDRVFMDVSAIEPGVDFVETIDRAVGSCTALLVVIGKRWIECTDATGRRRLDDPRDFIRLEVSTALRRNIRVIPVLVQGATMPEEEALPEDLKPLARRNAIEIGDTHWDSDLTELVETLERVLRGGTGPSITTKSAAETKAVLQGRRSKRAWLIGSIAAAVLVLAGLLTGIDTLRNILFFGKMVTIPDVKSMPEQEAVDKIQSRGLQAMTEHRISPEGQAGTVIDQIPQAGTKLEKGKQVQLVVVVKPPEPELVIVPNVVKQPLASAVKTLGDAGLQAGDITNKVIAKVPPGTVIDQIPQAGTKLEKGKQVQLVVVVKPPEPELVIVPNVVKQPLERASQMLTEAGLQAGNINRQQTANVYPGIVLDQKIKGGSRVQRGTRVDLLVATQPAGTVPGGETPTAPKPRKVLVRGKMEVRQTYLFDLDTGRVSKDDADFWFEAVTATERYLTPRNGSAIGFMKGKASYESCARTKMTELRIPVTKLPVNQDICVRTSQGRFAALRLQEPVGLSPGVLKISYIVWE